MTHCPTCHNPLQRSTELIPGRVVVACRTVCRRFAVEPPEGIAWEWLPGGPDLVSRLERSGQAASQTAAIVTSEDDDPRWERLMG